MILVHRYICIPVALALFAAATAQLLTDCTVNTVKYAYF
jgi:hypothetical protein